MMAVIATISIAIMTKASSLRNLVLITLGKQKNIYEKRLDNLSLINLSLAVLKTEFKTLDFQPLNDDLRELLDWWMSNGNFLPTEDEMWRTNIYNSIISDGKAVDLKNTQMFQGLMNVLISNGVFDNKIANDTSIGVYSFGNPPTYLVISKIGKFTRWALVTQRYLTQYMVVTNRETTDNGYPIYYITGDVLDGPLYTTDVLNIWGNPVFKGEVVVGGLNIVEGSDPTFENGYSVISGEPEFVLDEDFANDVFNSYRIKVKDIRKISENEETGLLLTAEEFPYDVRVDGIYVSENVSKLIVHRWDRDCEGRHKERGEDSRHRHRCHGRWKWIPAYEITYDLSDRSTSTYNATVSDLETGISTPIRFNGIILSETDLYISSPDNPSFFSGMITLSSENNVYIRGNIVYSYLRTGSDSFETNTSLYNDISSGNNRDRLNIVAYNNVRIRYYVPDNLYITAAIFALMGKFEIDTHDLSSPLDYPLKDTLHVFGMITQNSRGIMGYFDPYWGPIAGFLKDYVYDRRLYAPPYPLATPNMGGSLSVIDIR